MVSQNVEMALGTSRCDECVGPVGVVTAGCGQWVVDLLCYLIMKYPTPLVSTFWQPHPYFLFNFCSSFFILVTIYIYIFSIYAIYCTRLTKKNYQEADS